MSEKLELKISVPYHCGFRADLITRGIVFIRNFYVLWMTLFCALSGLLQKEKELKYFELDYISLEP